MSKYTKITTLSKEDVNVNYSIIGSENIPTTTISALKKIGKDQLVNLKAEVTEISGTKKSTLSFRENLQNRKSQFDIPQVTYDLFCGSSM